MFEVRTYSTGPITGGFCDPEETVEFDIRIVKQATGKLVATLAYKDNFSMELSDPIVLRNETISSVNKTIWVEEEFLSSSPTALEGSTMEGILRLVKERLVFHGFVFP